jgi:hypothetical protein
LFAVAACASKKELPPPPVPKDAPPPPAEKKKIGPTDFGSCTLKASGAFTGEETIQGDAKSVSSKYWQSDDQKSSTPMPALTINCSGKDMRISIVAAPDANVPYGLKTYDIKKNGELVLLGRAGTGSFDQLSDFAGTVVIDDFSDKHVKGSINITALQGRGRKKVAIEGTFDFACPGMAGCAK